jgi:hypothetical protein
MTHRDRLVTVHVRNTGLTSMRDVLLRFMLDSVSPSFHNAIQRIFVHGPPMRGIALATLRLRKANL